MSISVRGAGCVHGGVWSALTDTLLLPSTALKVTSYRDTVEFIVKG